MYALSKYIGVMLIEEWGYMNILTLGFIIAMAPLVLLIACNSFIMLVIGLSLLN